MTDKLNELFVDGQTETSETSLPEEGVQEETVNEETIEEPEVSEEGTEGTEETHDDVDVEFLKKKVEELEREKRLLQSKKDREIWEMQQKLKQLEEAVLSKKQEPEETKPQLDPEEIKELLFEDPVEAIKRVIETMTPEMIEKVFPKVAEKQTTAKQQEIVAAWQRDADYLGKLPDYAEIVNNPEHPLMKAMGEYITKNKDAYLMAGKTTLVIDALKYAKSKVNVKRESKPEKKKASIVGKKSSAIAPEESKSGTIDELFE